MAAGQAASLGARTLVLEKMPRPGLKLRISGKGRCNLTNTCELADFLPHFGRNGRFLRQAFHRFFSADLIDFLRREGVNTVTERGGRVFPVSEQAQDVVDALLRFGYRHGVEIRTGVTVRALQHDAGRVTGVQTSAGEFPAAAVILATGGASYPGTGSSGDGYHLASALGHTIVPVRPALVPLTTAGDLAQRLQGLSLRNVSVSVWLDGDKTDEQFGEMLFTHFGVSGPIILTLSRLVVDALAAHQQVELSIDLKPALDHPKLDARLLRDLDAGGKRQMHTLLKELLPQSLIVVCLDQTGIPSDQVGHQVTAAQRQRLRTWLKDFRLTVTGHRGFREAIVTAGGVDLREVDPRTCASRLVPNLYFAGEILDLDGDTGGYNLQSAFSTGWLAGRSAAEALNAAR